MNITVISCSLDPSSRSYVMAQKCLQHLKDLGVEAQLCDLRDYNLQLRGTLSATETYEVEGLKNAIQNASAVIVASPVYNFGANAGRGPR